MARRSASVVTSVALLLGIAAAHAQNAPQTWLDRPLSGWNKAGAAVPQAPRDGEAKASIVSRCRLTPPQSTRAEQAVGAAGWIPFWNFDQQLVREDVEIVGGMREADGMCRPGAYNLFVFVDGRFAGTLSPALMASRLDAASAAVRMPLPNITAEFARYTDKDPLCCPSSHVTVRYRIDRTTAGAIIEPVDVRNTRP